MPEAQKTEMNFQEKGDKVIWKRDIPNMEMDSRQVLVEIDSLEKGIEKTKLEVQNFEMQIKNAKEVTTENLANLKKLKRFEEKMTKIQESKAKAIYEEVKDACREAIEKEYKHDEGLTPKHNKHQKYCLYQKKIAIHEKAAKELAPKIITRLYYKESIIENPFTG